MPDAQKTLILNTISHLPVKRPGELYNLIVDYVKDNKAERVVEDPFAKHFDDKKITIHRSDEACVACEG